MAHLPVFAFDEGESYPTRWDVGTVADGRHTLPKVFGWVDDLGLTRLGAVAFDAYAFSQLIGSFLSDLSVHLGEIGPRMLVFRVQQFLDEFSLIGEEQGTFAVMVKSTSSIHARGETEFIKCPMPSLGCELAEYAKRLVEQNHHNVVL